MNARISITAALVCAVAVAVSAAQTPDKTAATKEVTVAGCVQKEADYRKEHDKGRGGVAGTGVGAGDEYVLTNVKSASDASAAYELTGANEKLVAGHLGHRVEITGILKSAAVSPSGAPTGGATAGKPPKGVDVVSKDLRLRELEVSSVKMVSASCTTR